MRRTQWATGSAVALALIFAGAATVATSGSDHAADTADSASASASAEMTATPRADSADAGFARDMAIHHQQAVEMSFIVRDLTGDEDVRRLAYDIANTQAGQRGMMLGWLDLWELPKTTPAGQKPMGWMAGGHGGHGEHSQHSMDGMEGMDGMDGMAGADGSPDPAATGFEAHDGALMPGMATRTELDQLRRAEGKQAEILFLQLMTDHHKGGVDMARGCAELCTVPAEKRLAQGMVEAQRSELNLMADMLAARGAKPRS